MEAISALEIYRQAAQDGARPESLLTVSEWADEYRTLSQRASAEPGPWRTSRTPYLREIMDCLSPASLIEQVVFMKGAQIGGTEAGNNWIGYIIHKAPGPMMCIQPTVEMAKRNSRQRIDPLIEESDVLRDLVSDPRSRDSSNTVLAKEFPGGLLVMTGANSAVGLRSMAARYLFLDEVDAYPGDVDGEGDPIKLALARTRTFSRRKVFLVSTPKVTGLSRIEAAYEDSDQRKYWVPCPFCHEFQVLRFGQLRWEKGQAQDAVYVCEHCETAIENYHKQFMLEMGEWRAAAPGDGRTAGFHLSSLYSPVGWFSWGDAAELFEETRKNPSLLQVFVNTVLGETWAEQGEAPEWQRLYERRETYPIAIVPNDGLFLTAGADVQKDRIEFEVVAWGRGKESWSVDYQVIEGSPASDLVWRELSAVANRTYRHQQGAVMQILKFAIDSGYSTSEVYAWARTQANGRIVVVKGDSRTVGMINQANVIEVGPSGKRLLHGVKVWPINSGIIKEELYRWLRLEKPTVESGQAPPPGFCHFPQYNEEYFKQLTAEQLVTRVVKGYRKPEWQKMRDRNEGLDCRVYARAAAAIFGMDRFGEQQWDELAASLKRASMPAELRPQQQPQPAARFQVYAKFRC